MVYSNELDLYTVVQRDEIRRKSSAFRQHGLMLEDAISELAISRLRQQGVPRQHSLPLKQSPIIIGNSDLATAHSKNKVCMVVYTHMEQISVIFSISLRTLFSPIIKHREHNILIF